MDSERPNPQSADYESPVSDPRMIDPSTPLPSPCRTFRLSEIPLDMDKDALCQCLDSVEVGRGNRKGNSKVFSLATYRSWQVATVSFHQEPDESKTCKPGDKVPLRLSKRKIMIVPSHQESDEYKRRKPDHAVQLRLSSGQVETRAIPVIVIIDCDFYSITPLYQPVATAIRYE
jgi:hypothetical protein